MRQEQFQLQTNLQVQKLMEEALLNCYHLNSISITGIIIDDLPGYLTTILNVNQHLKYIQMV
jgi:hypothetical protein